MHIFFSDYMEEEADKHLFCLLPLDFFF